LKFSGKVRLSQTN